MHCNSSRMRSEVRRGKQGKGKGGERRRKAEKGSRGFEVRYRGTELRKSVRGNPSQYPSRSEGGRLWSVSVLLATIKGLKGFRSKYYCLFKVDETWYFLCCFYRRTHPKRADSLVVELSCYYPFTWLDDEHLEFPVEIMEENVNGI